MRFHLEEPSQRQRIATRLFWLTVAIPAIAIAGLSASSQGLWHVATLAPAAIALVFVALATIVPARISCWFTGWIS